MRRFSQRNSLVTLNEINITPLLDLAFVLLIIFVITRPMLEQNVNLQLPENMGAPDNRHIDRSNIRMVEVTESGNYYLNGRPCSIGQLEGDLRTMYARNPRLIVDIRADKRVAWDKVLAVMNACLRNHITQFSARTAPLEQR
jgi:biopolymer transport protein ExbD